MSVIVHTGDCLDVLRTLPDCSVDSVVTDPPYGLSFMGKKWDYDVPQVDVWRECLRVLKPGGHLLAFAGTRTQHRMAVHIEDAGFEIRDMIAWVYGSGFPKSLDVSKAIDKAAGTEREDKYEGAFERRAGPTGNRKCDVCGKWLQSGSPCVCPRPQDTPATDAARQWQGWGTALKPAMEPITVARKPLAGTVAENVLAHGTGAINVDACRVGTEAVTINTWNDGAKPFGGGAGHEYTGRTVHGRWPANLIHDGSDEVVGLFPVTKNGGQNETSTPKPGMFGVGGNEGPTRFAGDSGSAARFFYCAKASKADRDEWCDGLEAKTRGQEYGLNTGGSTPQQTPHKHEPQRNHHPTVKPTALMRYLCRLVTPPGGVVLDPFMGSGSTGKAAILEGFRFIGIEREAEYCEIARARISSVSILGVAI